MAINVAYQVPKSLLQQQQQAEQRAYQRQVNLMTMQQNFQREQAAASRQFQRDSAQMAYDNKLALADANRDFQRETMQTAYERQRERAADERAYQQELLAHREDREDAARRKAEQLAKEQQNLQRIQQLQMQMWQDSERERQNLEKAYSYSDAQLAELKQIKADEMEAMEQHSQGLLSDEQYGMALQNLRQRRMGIMPDTPRPEEETQSVGDWFEENFVWNDQLNAFVGKDEKGKAYTLNPAGKDARKELEMQEQQVKSTISLKAMDAVLKQGDWDKDKFKDIVQTMSTYLGIEPMEPMGLEDLGLKQETPKERTKREEKERKAQEEAYKKEEKAKRKELEKKEKERQRKKDDEERRLLSPFPYERQDSAFGNKSRGIDELFGLKEF